MNQYPALTALRFVAALLVFVFHFPPHGGLWDVVAGEGHVGVNIFFVLSGFLIALRYGERFARGEARVGEYFIRRAARILPLYYAVLFLSMGLSEGEPGFMALLPELTLTQALFGESVHHLVIPTSWSLTVEECFYALAPLVFVGIAAARRRVPDRPLLAGTFVLVAVTCVLFVSGAAIWSLLDGRGPGFLRTPQSVVAHTLFGRFYDFAIGVFAALAFAGPVGHRIRMFLARSIGGLAATVASVVLIVVAQWGMHAAGGIEGPRWAAAWTWTVLLAPATGLLIVSLTASVNPAARVLSRAPFVYLGRISYALYLIQLTPLGKGLVYRVLPQDGLWGLALLYAALTAVSAVLYELVEEPARILLTRMAGLDRAPVERRDSKAMRLVAAGALSAAVAFQGATWAAVSASKRAGAPTLDAVRAAGVAADDVVTNPPAYPGRGGEVFLVDLPASWREGWGGDLRAPSALHVFADGRSVPFSRREPAAPGPAAYFRGPRAEQLTLRIPAAPEELVVVRDSPSAALRLQVRRILASPRDAYGIAALCAALLVLGTVGAARIPLAPRTCFALAFAATAAWWALDLHHAPWALAVVGAECLAALALAVRAIKPPSRPAAVSTAPVQQRG